MSADRRDDAVRSLREVILAGERYRQVFARQTQLGVTETQALSYLAIYGSRGQNDLATDLGLTSSAGTALVDRLEREGIARRSPHPSDRRRLVVQLTDKGQGVVNQSHRLLASSFDRVPIESLRSLTTTLHALAEDLRRALDSAGSEPPHE